MYLQPEQAMESDRPVRQAFPGGQMIFDLPPAGVPRAGRRGLRTSLRYRVPPMPFSLSAGQAADLVNTVPGVRAVRDCRCRRDAAPLFNAAAVAASTRTRALRRTAAGA